MTALDNKKSDATILASYSFTLDGNGNRTQVAQNEPLTLTPNTDSVSYTYNIQKNRLMTANTISFGYDNEGQLSSGYSSTYTFDYEHRLKTIGSTIQFYYDRAGNRLKAVRNGVETRYIYDASGNLLAEADASNNITRYYIHGLGLMAMVMPANEVYTYHFNAVGSTIAMTDATQAIVNKYSYDPFGKILSEQETVQQPFKFVGQYGVMTEPNGFLFMRARYYDPEVGRFISEDPIGFEGGDTNLMAYASNNPVNYSDPLGLLGTGYRLDPGPIYGTPYMGPSGGSTSVNRFDDPIAHILLSTGEFIGSIYGTIIGAELPTVIYIEELLDLITSPHDLEASPLPNNCGK